MNTYRNLMTHARTFPRSCVASLSSCREESSVAAARKADTAAASFSIATCTHKTTTQHDRCKNSGWVQGKRQARWRDVHAPEMMPGRSQKLGVGWLIYKRLTASLGTAAPLHCHTVILLHSCTCAGLACLSHRACSVLLDAHGLLVTSS